MGYRQATRVPPIQPAVREAAVPTKADWYLVLRMPAVTSQYESGIDTMKGRYGEWLNALSQAGFTPMKLSDVYRRMKSDEGIPRNTVVMVFDPGFRRTYEIVSPILTSHGWPAVWMTPKVEMDRGHREYLTFHQTSLMTDSGAWDVGFIQKDGSIVLQAQEGKEIRLGTRNTVWSETSGGLALNRGGAFQQMHRLTVNSDWLPSDLVNRVRAEVPIDRPMYLTQGAVQNLNWGTSTDPSSPNEKHFDVTLANHRRGTLLAWFGTSTHANFKIEAEAHSLVGRIALHLRWNEVAQSGIIVTASNRDVHIRYQARGTSRDVRTLTRSGLGPNRQMKLNLELNGQNLTVSVDGRPPVSLALPAEAPSGPGLVQMNVYDAIKGSARVDGLQLLYTPLP
jgi:hypothetical protein